MNFASLPCVVVVVLNKNFLLLLIENKNSTFSLNNPTDNDRSFHLIALIGDIVISLCYALSLCTHLHLSRSQICYLLFFSLHAQFFSQSHRRDLECGSFGREKQFKSVKYHHNTVTRHFIKTILMF